MDIRLKKKLIRMLKKMNNSKPTAQIKDFGSDIFDLEMELRHSINESQYFKTPELKPIFEFMSKEQAEHYESISWLLNPHGPKGSGKTYLMAVAFIEQSLYTGDTIRVFNHGNTPFAIREMINRISEIMSNVKGLSLTVNNSKSTIKVKRINSYKDEIKEFKND